MKQPKNRRGRSLQRNDEGSFHLVVISMCRVRYLLTPGTVCKSILSYSSTSSIPTRLHQLCANSHNTSVISTDNCSWAGYHHPFHLAPALPQVTQRLSAHMCYFLIWLHLQPLKPINRIRSRRVYKELSSHISQKKNSYCFS